MSDEQNEKLYVIKHVSGQFWSGKRWVTEFPDAKVYDDYFQARSNFRVLCAKANLQDNEAWVIEDYGTYNEKVVLTSYGV